MRGAVLFLIAIAVVTSDHPQWKWDVEKCKKEMERGRQVLRAVSGQLVAEEHHRQEEERRKLSLVRPPPNYRNVRFAASPTASICPQPNATIFPRPTTSTTTRTPIRTTKMTTKVTTKATTVAKTEPATTTNEEFSSATTVSEELTSATTESESWSGYSSASTDGNLDVDNNPLANDVDDSDNDPETQTAPKDSPISHSENSRTIFVPSLFHTQAELDPYVSWMKKLHRHLSKDEEVCNGPAFKGIHTVTEDQLWGFISLLLSNHGSSFCAACDQMVERMEKMLLSTNPILLSEEERYLHGIIVSFFPKRKAICSTLMPSCYANYEAQTSNTTNSTICVRCSLCMAGLTWLQQRFVLDPKALSDALAWLQSSVFHNICAELCAEYPPDGSTTSNIFPNGVDYGQCMNFTNEAFAFVTAAAKNILKPEYFCSVELEWCEMNATPNIIVCLKELCDEGLPQQFDSLVCKLIPEDPGMANEYLNINPAEHPVNYLKPQSGTQRDEL